MQQENLAAGLAEGFLGIGTVRRIAHLDGFRETGEPLLEMPERLEHLRDALPGDVLERAGLEDLEDSRLHEATVILVRELAGAKDLLGGGHDGVRRRSGRLDDRAELV